MWESLGRTIFWKNLGIKVPIYSDQCTTVTSSFIEKLQRMRHLIYIFDIFSGSGIFCPLIMIFCISYSSVLIRHVAYIFSCMF